MDKIRSCGRSPLFLLCAVVAGLLAGAHAQTTIGSWTVEYDSAALTVQAIDESSAPTVSVELRNTSQRPITAFAIEIGTAYGRVELGSTVLKPDARYVASFDPRLDAAATRRVHIKAVLFGDEGPDEGTR